MLIHSASQLLTLSGGPQPGSQLGRLGIIPNGSILICDEKIVDVGETEKMAGKYPGEQQISAKNCVVMPGLIDPHTHLVWAGDRATEFEMRLEGKSYLDIMAAGGGIQSTVNATRSASYRSLFAQSEQRALEMFCHGTTTAEAKSGYGLEMSTELRQLEVLLDLNEKGPLEIFPTFLGAHAVPKEYKTRPERYVDTVCNKMLPAVKDLWIKINPERQLPFVDVFCEKGAFNLAQSRRILEAAKRMGYPLKIHTDEFENLGGASLAAELGAISADHLVKTSTKGIKALADSKTAAVSLPCTPFGLGESEYSPAKAMIEAGCLFALASDLNPGTAWCGNMQFTMALACRYMRLTPAQVIAASTINAAAAIGQHEHIGSIETGKQADLIILSVSDFRQIAYQFGTNLVSTIIKKGKTYTSRNLCSTLEKARTWYPEYDAVHGFEHIERVYRLCEKIGPPEGVDMEILLAAALLHDASGSHPEEGNRKNHHLRSAEFAETILLEEGWEPGRIHAVQHCIRTHRFRKDESPQTIEAKVLFDADKLDVIGAIGITRALAYAFQVKQPVFADPSKEFMESGNKEAGEPHSVYHEYVFKLIKINETLLTETAKKIAEHRQLYLNSFFEELADEMKNKK